MNKKNKILEVKDLSVKYNDKLVLKDINLTVNEGDFIGIVGSNGSGKTTLIKYILGILDNANISKNSKLEKSEFLEPKGSISYISQNIVKNYKVFPAKVKEVILTGLLASKKSLFYNSKDRKKVDEIMEKIDIKDLEDFKIGELSGGQKQKVYLARAMVSDPKLIVLDEPLSAIDEASQEQIYNIIDRLNNNGTTIIMISHDIDETIKHTNKIVLLDNEMRYFGDTKGYVECYDCKGDF